jgi:hypothetical protein
MKRNKVKDAIAMVNMLHANKSLSLVDLRYNNNINVAEINNLIARISDAERIEARIKYKLTVDNDESLSDYKDGDSFLDDNPAGQGTVKLIADDQKLFIPTLFYNKYYKHGLEDILPLRLKAAGVDDTVVLPVIRLSEYALRFIIKQIAFKLEQGFGNLVIPLNIEDKHWVGLLVRAGANNLEIEYLDSEQNGLSPVFKEQILSYFKGTAVNIVESIFERQKYNNCGPELVENFVKLLGGERVSQEAAPYLHSLLLEQKLIEDVIEEEKPPDPLMVAKALPKKSDITNQEVTHFLKSKEENNIKYTIIDAQGRKISQSLLDEATREQLLYYAKTGILFDSARRAIDEGYGIEIQSFYPIIEPRNEYLAAVSIDNTVSLFLLNEKVWAQLIYFSRTGTLFESARQALEDGYNFNPGYGIYTLLLGTSSMRPMVSIEVSTNSINESEEGSIKDEEVELFMEQGNLNDIMQGSSESFYPSIELPNMQQVITALSPFILYYFSYNKALPSPLDIGGMDLFFDFGFL